jgi:hypothetical protein
LLFLLLLLVPACSPVDGGSPDPAAGPTLLLPTATLVPLPTVTPFQPVLAEASPTAAPLLPTPTLVLPTATSAAPESAVIPSVPTVGGGGRGPCDNVFFPFVPGTQWTYRMDDLDGTTRTMQLNVSQSGDTQARIDVLNLGTGVRTQAVADCQNGAILNFPLMVFGPLFGDEVAGEMNANHVSGVFLPAEADLIAADWNMAWNGEYTASGVIHTQYAGQAFTVLLSNSTIRMAWQNIGRETITVAAGTYADAYKVSHQAVADGTLEGGGAVVQAQLTVNAVQWYAPYVGLLRNEVVSATLTARGVTLPVLINGSGELIEFRPGQ